MKILLILLLTIQTTWAISLTPIEKGQVSPKTGYIITPNDEKKLRKKVTDLETLKKLRITQDDILKNRQIQIDLYKKKIRNNKLENTLWFIGGVLFMGGGVYLGSKL